MSTDQVNQQIPTQATSPESNDADARRRSTWTC